MLGGCDLRYELFAARIHFPLFDDRGDTQSPKQ